MSFRNFKKDQESKRERLSVISSLNGAIKKLESKRNEYAEKAKSELIKGNSSQYSAYVALLKNTMFNLSQAKDMLANFTIACDLLDMQDLNKKFVKSINSVMKEVYKVSSSINVAASQKIFNKALYKQNYTSTELQQLLKENNMSFVNSVNTISDISDEEVRRVLESEIRKDESNIDDTLAKLEKQYEVTEVKPEKIAEVQTAVPVHKSEAPAEAVPNKNDGQPAIEDNSAKVSQEKQAEGSDGSKIDRELNVSGNANRPQNFKDYLGQPAAVATISAHITRAKLMNKALPHVLLCGSSGMGKTTFARIIANEMGTNFYEISKRAKLNNVVRILKGVKRGDIVFIDEIHDMSNDIVETVLYPAMEDYELHTTEGNSLHANCKTVKLEPFTLIGATTSSGRLLRPLYNRFPVNITLKDYPKDIIATIVKNSFRVNNAKISDELCYEITDRSQGLPRKANYHVEGILALATQETKSLNLEITEKHVNDYFGLQKIDGKGLGEEDRKLLKIIIDTYNGGPVGLESLAKAMNMETDVVDKTHEPYLVRLGFLNIRPQGRFATEAAYKYLGRTPVNSQPNEEVPPANENVDKQTDETQVNSVEPDDDIYEYECKTGEYSEKFAERFMPLLSGEAKPSEKTLDEIFPDADKDYESIAKNKCVLKTGNRELYCDSKLERRFLAYLFGKGFITDAKTEALELEYSSGRMSGKRYFADFVLKLRDGTVAVVEMKNLSSMGYHLNIDKYEALERFCKENGFRYAEIGKDHTENRYVSAEEIKLRTPDGKLTSFIKQKIEENGICNSADLDAVSYDVKDLVCILLNDRSLKNIDRTGSSPQIVSADE